MCGIAGIVDFAGTAINPARLVAMAASLAHRGPDGEGFVLFPPADEAAKLDILQQHDILRRGAPATAGFSHRRLAIIDLTASGAQPMSDASGRYWITFNGEIYNYVELREELLRMGHRFRSTSDTEVILHAYMEWNTECVHRFNGMFAFGIWDCHERRLFCARDRLGIKPFYYHVAHKRLHFASEQKALLVALDERPAANLPAMADYLSFSYVVSAETMFRGIHRLLPGTWMLADHSGMKLHTYWDPVFNPDDGRRDESWIEELRGLLDDAIRLQLRSDVPVGAHLSGGIDSSAVCCLAARHLPKLLTFTARFAEGPSFDETPYARLVVRRIGAEHREVIPQSTDLMALLPKILYHLDEPVEAASIFGKFHVAEIVGRSVKVVLGGQGGDELFGGYDWYVKNLFTAASFGGWNQLGNHSAPRFLLAALRRESAKRLGRSLWKNFGDADLANIFMRNWSRIPAAQVEQIFLPGALACAQSPEERFLGELDQMRERRCGDRMFKFDMRHYLEALLTSEDRLSMAFSVESRVPLLDHRIAELAGRMGFERKTMPGRSKDILRRALVGTVPGEILARQDKLGFPTPIARWLSDPSLNLMESLVFNDNPFARQHFDLSRLRRLFRSRTYWSSDWSERLWRVITLCVWGKVFKLG
jgi:asparagine synthase (glutamine-hydrolysing)